MEIYADVVFMINLVMDTFILWIVSKLMKKRLKFWRLALGGFTMAILYCVLMFVTALHIYLNIFAAVLMLMIGVVIAFAPKSVPEFLKITVLSHVVAFSLGGLGVALFYFTNIGEVVSSAASFSVSHFSLKILLASTCFFFVVFKFFTGFLKNRLMKNQELYPVKIFFGEGDVNFTALMDTGNSLRDPISNSPVIIAEFDAVKDFLPDCLKVMFYEKRENDLEILTENLGPMLGRVRMIPFASLGKQNGMLLGFRPDRVEITNESATDTVDDVVVGIYNFSLSKNGRYQGLLSPEVIHNI